MSIIEDALKLSKDEKVKLYYALQEDLNFEGSILEEDLSSEQSNELLKRENEISNGTMKTISETDFNDFLKKRRDGFKAGSGRNSD